MRQVYHPPMKCEPELVIVIDINPISLQWSVAGGVLTSPARQIAEMKEKLRFSASFNRHFNQHNPVALIQGNAEQLQTVLDDRPLEHRHKFLKNSKSDHSDFCIPVTFTQLQQLRRFAKDKDFEGYDRTTGIRPVPL